MASHLPLNGMTPESAATIGGILFEEGSPRFLLSRKSNFTLNRLHNPKERASKRHPWNSLKNPPAVIIFEPPNGASRPVDISFFGRPLPFPSLSPWPLPFWCSARSSTDDGGSEKLRKEETSGGSRPAHAGGWVGEGSRQRDP